MWQKGGTFSDVLFLALVVSVLRPDNHLDSNWLSESYVGSSVDELGPTSVHLYLHNIRNSYSYDSPAKTNILLQETLDVIREVNSLGRYCRQSPAHSNQLIAYLVSGSEEGQHAITAAIASTSSASSSISSSSILSPSISSPSILPSPTPSSSEAHEDSSPTQSDDEVLFDCEMLFFISLHLYLGLFFPFI